MVNITTPLTIIGAALPRTGTTSLKTALEQLGHKVFHGSIAFQPGAIKYVPLFYEVARADETENPTQYRQALDAVVEELSADGFTAILDQPGCWIYRELLEYYYPNAKILHTVRDQNAWAKSMVETAFSMDLLAWQPPFSLQPNAYMGRAIGRWAKQRQ